MTHLPTHTRHNGNLGMMAGALAVGVAAGMAAHHVRKAAVQGVSVAQGDWLDALKTEHRMVQKLFDALLATSDNQAAKRKTLLASIAYALTKHATQEENVIYPALKRMAADGRAPELIDDHAGIKAFIFELKTLPAGDPSWLPKAREFHDLIERHIRAEEDEILPLLMGSLSDKENAELTAMMNWEGYKVA